MCCCRTTSKNIRNRINVPMEQQLELKKSRDQGRDLVPSLMRSALYYKRATHAPTVCHTPLCPRHTAPPRHRGHMESSAVIQVPLRVSATQAIIHCFPHINTREKEPKNIQLRGGKGINELRDINTSPPFSPHLLSQAHIRSRTRPNVDHWK